MSYLRYKIYANEEEYSELILNNEYFRIQIGINQIDYPTITDFTYKMTFKIIDDFDNPVIQHNLQLFEQFMYDLSTKITSYSDVYRIEIEFMRDNSNIHKKYIFDKGQFHDLELGYTSNDTMNQALIYFVIDSMEQNFKQGDE